MYLAVDPDHLPVIASQLGVSAEDLMLMLGAAAPVAVPLPPGDDDVSALIPAACVKQGGRFFPTTLNGVGMGSEGAVALPVVGDTFAAGDLCGGTEVAVAAVAI